MDEKMRKALNETKDWILSNEELMAFYGDNRIKDTKKILVEFANSQGQDNCWWHPDLLRKLCEIWEIQIADPKLPSEEEFKDGCDKYRKLIYQKGLLQIIDPIKFINEYKIDINNIFYMMGSLYSYVGYSTYTHGSDKIIRRYDLEVVNQYIEKFYYSLHKDILLHLSDSEKIHFIRGAWGDVKKQKYDFLHNLHKVEILSSFLRDFQINHTVTHTLSTPDCHVIEIL